MTKEECCEKGLKKSSNVPVALSPVSAACANNNMLITIDLPLDIIFKIDDSDRFLNIVFVKKGLYFGCVCFIIIFFYVYHV